MQWMKILPVVLLSLFSLPSAAVSTPLAPSLLKQPTEDTVLTQSVAATNAPAAQKIGFFKRLKQKMAGVLFPSLTGNEQKAGSKKKAMTVLLVLLALSALSILVAPNYITVGLFALIGISIGLIALTSKPVKSEPSPGYTDPNKDINEPGEYHVDQNRKKRSKVGLVIGIVLGLVGLGFLIAAGSWGHM